MRSAGGHTQPPLLFATHQTIVVDDTPHNHSTMVQSPLLGGKHGRRTEYSGDGDNYAELKSVTASTSGHMPAAKDEPVTCVANTFNFVGTRSPQHTPTLAPLTMPWANNGSCPPPGAVANLANAAVGAGVLAFPFAFRETGLVLVCLPPPRPLHLDPNSPHSLRLASLTQLPPTYICVCASLCVCRVH